MADRLWIEGRQIIDRWKKGDRQMEDKLWIFGR